MGTDKFFSVSMPVHHADKYLDETIESVLNQDYDNFELVLVNDASTDGSPAICEKWQGRYPGKIRTVDNDVKGSLCARRTCIRESRGEYLYIMDADDTISSFGAMKKWNETIQETGCDLLIFNETERGKTTFRGTPFEEGKPIEGKDRAILYEQFAVIGELNVLWDKVFHRELVDSSEEIYRENAFLSHGTDFFQSIAIISAAKKAVYLNEKLYEYRVTPGSITHRYNPNMLRSAEALIRRRNQLAQTWDPQPEDLEEKLKASALNEFCTVINKARKADLPAEEKEKIYQDISRNPLFLEALGQKGRLPLKKQEIVSLLARGQIKLLNTLLSVSGKE